MTTNGNDGYLLIKCRKLVPRPNADGLVFFQEEPTARMVPLTELYWWYIENGCLMLDHKDGVREVFPLASNHITFTIHPHSNPTMIDGELSSLTQELVKP